jgi:hypothetical protein
MTSLLIKLPHETELPQSIDDTTLVQIEITEPIAVRLVLNILKLGPEVGRNLSDWWTNERSWYDREK